MAGGNATTAPQSDHLARHDRGQTFELFKRSLHLIVGQYPDAPLPTTSPTRYPLPAPFGTPFRPGSLPRSSHFLPRSVATSLERTLPLRAAAFPHVGSGPQDSNSEDLTRIPSFPNSPALS